MTIYSRSLDHDFWTFNSYENVFNFDSERFSKWIASALKGPQQGNESKKVNVSLCRSWLI